MGVLISLTQKEGRLERRESCNGRGGSLGSVSSIEDIWSFLWLGQHSCFVCVQTWLGVVLILS